MTSTILIVEDEINTRDFLDEEFKEFGYKTQIVPESKNTLKVVDDVKPDLIVMDLGIEDVLAESLCEKLKKTHPEIPIVILTAKNFSLEAVNHFNLGAEEYVSKPVEIYDLMAKIRKRLNHKNKILKIDNLSVDVTNNDVKRGDKKIKLKEKEFALLHYLMMNEGVVMSRESILDTISSYPSEIEMQELDDYVDHLRKKIDEGFDKKLIRRIRDYGYTIRA